jgi:ATP-binding cassette subfamily B protein
MVEKTPVYLHGHFPALLHTRKGPEHRLQQLEARNLTYHYSGNGRGISNINLDLPHGSFTVVTGRIGSGKTTLLRSLLGLLPLDEGTITWNGQDITAGRDTFLVPPRAAYTGQTPRLFSDTLQNNILMGLPAGEVDIEGALYAAVLEKDVLDLEQGLDTTVGPRGVKLSGGQMQRTSAARMFARQPELYVFDDLSSALDVETEQALWSRLFERTAGMNGNSPTCLVVSHRRPALQRADHIIVMQDGRVADEGTLDELLGRSREMQRLWRSEE